MFLDLKKECGPATKKMSYEEYARLENDLKNFDVSEANTAGWYDYSIFGDRAEDPIANAPFEIGLHPLEFDEEGKLVRDILKDIGAEIPREWDYNYHALMVCFDHLPIRIDIDTLEYLTYVPAGHSVSAVSFEYPGPDGKRTDCVNGPCHLLRLTTEPSPDVVSESNLGGGRIMKSVDKGKPRILFMAVKDLNLSGKKWEVPYRTKFEYEKATKMRVFGYDSPLCEYDENGNMVGDIADRGHITRIDGPFPDWIPKDMITPLAFIPEGHQLDGDILGLEMKGELKGPFYICTLMDGAWPEYYAIKEDPREIVKQARFGADGSKDAGGNEKKAKKKRFFGLF